MTYVYKDGDQAVSKTVFNADLTVTFTETYYRLQNGAYTQVGSSEVINQAQGGMSSTMNYADVALKYGFMSPVFLYPVDQAGHRYLPYEFLECLRYLVASGQYPIETAEALLGNTYVTTIKPSDFVGAPSTLSTAAVGSMFFTGGDVLAIEYMHKTFPNVDDSALMAALSNGKGMPWSIPTGQTSLQAGAADWKGVTPTVFVTALGGAITIDNTQVTDAINNSNNGTVVTPTYAVTHTTNEVGTHFDLHTTSTYTDAIQKIYIAFFNRPADPNGFNYYDTALKTYGGNVYSAAEGFGSSLEYQQTYAGMNIEQRIGAIYQNLFNRPAEPAGLKWWVDDFNAGKLTLGNIALAILNGAQNGDAMVVANRVEMAKLFTASLDNTTKVSEYAGLASCFAAKDWMKTVGEDHATVVAATAKLPDVLKMIGASGTLIAGATGDTITLNDVKANSILSFSTADAGKVDTVNHWNADKIDVSGFQFATAAESVVTITGMTQQITATTAGFFHGAGVAIEKVGADSWVYVDSDHNGNFNPTTDVTIHVVGSTVVAGDVLF